jgi:hypothetical protein
MPNHLEHLARRVEDDPFFLACLLKLYAQSEALDEEQLAAALGCSRQILVQVRLCRAPAREAEQFQRDVDRIAARFQVHADVLAEAVRRGQAILHMRRPANQEGGTLLAARDADKDKDAPGPVGGEA